MLLDSIDTYRVQVRFQRKSGHLRTVVYAVHSVDYLEASALARELVDEFNPRCILETKLLGVISSCQ